MTPLLTFGCGGKNRICVFVLVSASCWHLLIGHFYFLACRISRGEANPDSNVHFFTSHFMTTLKNNGPESVASWTAKKKINVFQKKLIFIPVNADLHWSLCVVVNPGLIANYFDVSVEETEEHAW